MNLDDLMNEENLQIFCQQHHIRKLAVFGSALTDDFRADSDIDLLVEFEPGHTPGLAFFTIQEELSELLGRQVDLHTPNSLSPYFRETVIKEARELALFAQVRSDAERRNLIWPNDADFDPWMLHEWNRLADKLVAQA